MLIVDDSMFFRKVLTDNLSQQKNLEVIGYAINAFDANNKIKLMKPDVVTLDVEMPGMSGIDFLKKLIPEHPVPVILVTSLNIGVFEALHAGAVDFVRKPDMSRNDTVTPFIKTLTSKIQVASTAKVRTDTAPAAAPRPPVQLNSIRSSKIDNMIIAIGASTGGTEATLEVLRQLPADYPGIVVTQHMPAGFTQMYAERLNRICKMEVKEASNGDKILKGRVLIAPGDYQMEVVRKPDGYAVNCYPGQKVSGHRPSVDVLFTSMSKTVKSNGVGIILTGMGQDGAEGLLKMRNSGAYTIGQDKESCVVYGMPMVAHKIGAVCVQASCHNIPYTLQTYLNKL